MPRCSFLVRSLNLVREPIPLFALLCKKIVFLPTKEEKVDAAAPFLELVETHQAILHKICRMYRDQREEQEDLFQDILYQLWKSYPSFQGASSFGTWMYKIALCTAIARYRNADKKTLVNPSVSLPDTAVAQDENLEHLYEAIRRLPEVDRGIVGLYLDGYHYEEMAEILGISVNYVGVKLNRIRQQLKKQLNA